MILIKTESRKLEWTCFILFIFMSIIIAACHEPWFDEAQAWQIAKSASIKDILLNIPHYEGHPPMWHLVLAIPAKIGLPYELGLKIVGLSISIGTAGVLIFYSRLPKVARLVLPFTYFFFYQYGVIVRPYGLMLLVLLLLGMNLRLRSEHPWRVFLLLCLLCLTSAYGILIAGSISVCILWDLWQEKGFKTIALDVLHGSLMTALILLFFFALLLIAEILPRLDTYAGHKDLSVPVGKLLICAFFTFPAECFLTTSSWFSFEQMSMNNAFIPVSEMVAIIFIGVVIWIVALCASSKKNAKYLIISMLFFSVFSVLVHFSTHHLGIVFMLFLFWAEYISRDQHRFEIGRSILNKIAKNNRDKKLLHYTYILICGACMIIPLYWSISASINEINTEYFYSRSAASFMREHGLDLTRNFAWWNDEGSAQPISEGHDDYINVNVIGPAVAVNAYFPHNIFYNLNYGIDSQAFIYHKTNTYEESRAVVERWKSWGIPEVILGLPNLKLVYGDGFSIDDYSLVQYFNSGMIWKDKKKRNTMPLYVRKDIVDSYGLQTIEGGLFELWAHDLVITDEMQDAYKNGIPVKDILKPYLDLIYGKES